jgi:AAA domain
MKRLRVGLVVIDTLSRNLAGGDENGPDDMGAFVGNLDRIRDATGAHAAVIHHGPKTGDGPRGHSSLVGAADAIIKAAKAGDGTRTATVTDAKDDPSNQAMVFRLQVEELSTDEDDDPRTTCLVEELPGRTGAAASPEQPKLSSAARVAIDRLHPVMAEHSAPLPVGPGFPSAALRGVPEERWRTAFYDAKPGVKQDTRLKAFDRASEKLIAEHLVGTHAGWVWPVRPPPDNPDI